MHSALSFASILLAASGALALPQAASSSSAATEVRVVLQNTGLELGSQTVFDKVTSRVQRAPTGSTGPYETFELRLGAGAKQDLRCQALDLNGNPIVGTRGENVDTTFADGGNGPWTFREATEVSRVVCDPAFQKASAEDFQVRIILQNQAAELGVQTVVSNVEERAEVEQRNPGPFRTVEIAVGDLVDPALRCKLLNERGRQIVATRGENVDTTFSDAGKGAWTFRAEQKVSRIICDPAFVARPQQ